MSLPREGGLGKRKTARTVATRRITKAFGEKYKNAARFQGAALTNVVDKTKSSSNGNPAVEIRIESQTE